MPYHSQQDSFVYEVPISDQTWQLSPGEEFYIGEIESNMIINPVFDAELITNRQMPHPDQVHLGEEPVMEHTEFTFHAELTARRWPVPTANDSMQAPLNEGFLSEAPSTHHFLQRPFSMASQANQAIYPALDQSPYYPTWEQRGAGDVG
ncbi:uncharacterized protein EAE97_007453 [Botrytis byssoidea]|uniref:Uncharacterized protein n=1 Tax=Botrytis byssoidea TaxID=139641 RepID=A0A9P5IFD4_9HELO|nr:uncharacterized protein EAE97_007453 [Botrytis byssoidea]KAF7939373.1 hypothetical protein EAE97_007453 [Botrytis byssoidea]